MHYWNFVRVYMSQWIFWTRENMFRYKLYRLQSMNFILKNYINIHTSTKFRADVCNHNRAKAEIAICIYLLHRPYWYAREEFMWSIEMIDNINIVIGSTNNIHVTHFSNRLNSLIFINLWNDQNLRSCRS